MASRSGTNGTDIWPERRRFYPGANGKKKAKSLRKSDLDPQGRSRVRPGAPSPESPPGEPAEDDGHAEPAEELYGLPDLLIMHEEVPVREKNLPVVIARAHQLNVQGAGRCHVVPYVKEILEKPEEAERHARDFTAKEERHRTGERHDQFQQRASENHQQVTEPGLVRPGKEGKERMTRFVN